MKPIIQAAVALGFRCVIVLAGAVVQDALAQKSPMDRAMAQADAASAAEATSVPLMPDNPSSVVLSDPVTRQLYLSAMQRFYEYRANGYAYRSRVFEWQLLSSRVIFLTVLLLVIAGVYFAAVQFHVALAVSRRTPTHTPKADEATKGIDDTLKTELEFSAKGVVVKSSTLGVIVLALSLAFFYLYLVYVYPIQNVI